MSRSPVSLSSTVNSASTEVRWVDFDSTTHQRARHDEAIDTSATFL